MGTNLAACEKNLGPSPTRNAVLAILHYKMCGHDQWDDHGQNFLSLK
jgi:hypothetical protein